ncbi:hypothetical protein EAG_03565 [Camponotus floridanus]|uniref:Uncharacterized protein n=1 Tax=Camponotus floridanus TaxID=104421 RepID=E2AQ18_CAMFO|nr:hypothetical protein EAG_03565 [Camponotus floridanus]
MWETINVLLPYPTTIASDPKCVLILFAYPTCFLRRNDTSTSLPRQSQTAVQFEISIDSLQFTRRKWNRTMNNNSLKPSSPESILQERRLEYLKL